LLKKYGYNNPPITWDELEEQAAAIQKGEIAGGNKDFVGFVWQGNTYEGLTCDAVEWIASSYGGRIISPDKVITINNENAIAAVDKAASWVGTISPKGVLAFQEEDSRNLWQGGNAAFLRNWPYCYAAGQAKDSVIANKFDICPIPSSDGKNSRTIIGGWEISVSKYSKNLEIAVDVAKFLSSYDAEKIRAVEISQIPTMKALFEDKDVLAAQPFFGKLAEIFLHTVTRPSTESSPNYNAVSAAFYKSVHSVLAGEMDAKKAFEALALELKDITGFEIGENK
jgi:trehalose/maltose transport system substrate-binding protein